MKSIKGWFSEMHYTTKMAIIGTLAAIFLFALGYGCGAFTNISTVVDNPNAVVNDQPTQSAAPTEAPTTAAPAPTEAPSNETPAPSESEATPTEAPSQAAPAETPVGTAPTTPEEILNLYNTSINKVKTDATSVTRNYEDIKHNADKLEVPGALKSVGESLIGKFVKGNFDPVTYSTKDEIIANFPVSGETYSSKATPADIASAQCTDDGKYYNITLKFNTSVDPANGVGVGSAFNCMKTEEVMDAAGFVVVSFSVEYYDSVIECQIDKATGNVVKVVYTNNELMSVQAKMNLKAKVGLTFIDEYVIEY